GRVQSGRQPHLRLRYPQHRRQPLQRLSAARPSCDGHPGSQLLSDKQRINRVVTRTGDSGETGLADGSRLAKDAPVIEAMGDVDELNAALGVLRQKDRKSTRLNSSHVKIS